MNIRDQIAAARALRDEWVHPDNPSYGGCIELIEVEMGWLLESLDRACELLEAQGEFIDEAEMHETDDMLHDEVGKRRRKVAAKVRAFLAGEVTKP